MLRSPASRSARVRALLALHEADWSDFLTSLDRSPLKIFATENGSSSAVSPITTFGTLHGTGLLHKNSVRPVCRTLLAGAVLLSNALLSTRLESGMNITMWCGLLLPPTLVPPHVKSVILAESKPRLQSSNLSVPLA